MEIVFKGKTRSGKNILIRYPQPGDVRGMLGYINGLSQEKTFIRYQGEKETLKSESKYLKDILKKIAESKTVHLLAFVNNDLAAGSDIHMMDKTEKHIGIFGISVKNNFRGDGIGKLLMDRILAEAKKKLPDIKMVTLQVYSTNDIARSLYKTCGFTEYGILPNGITRNEKFEDAVLMYKRI